MILLRESFFFCLIEQKAMTMYILPNHKEFMPFNLVTLILKKEKINKNKNKNKRRNWKEQLS